MKNRVQDWKLESAILESIMQCTKGLFTTEFKGRDHSSHAKIDSTHFPSISITLSSAQEHFWDASATAEVLIPKLPAGTARRLRLTGFIKQPRIKNEDNEDHRVVVFIVEAIEEKENGYVIQRIDSPDKKAA